MTNLFFISSPLHFLEACNLAFQTRGDKNLAIIISKNTDAAARFERTIRANLTNFDHCIVLTENKKASKLSARKALMQSIKELVDLHSPQAIYTGNDRRIEFQFAMHCARQINPSAEGIYMDDGAISYLGHKSISNIFHRFIDPFLKKIVYGTWWNNALTTGASKWISTCYLAFPEKAHPLLSHKNLKPIDGEVFAREDFQKIGLSLLDNQSGEIAKLKNLKALFCLPVDDEFKTEQAVFLNARDRFLSDLDASEIAVKAHPRSTLDDSIKQDFDGCLILPKSIGFEALLPLLGKQTKIIGTASTALLTSRWLRPELAVASLNRSNDPRLNQLFDNLGISSVH